MRMHSPDNSLIQTVCLGSGSNSVHILPSLTTKYAGSGLPNIQDRRNYPATEKGLPHIREGIVNLRAHHLDRLIEAIEEWRSYPTGNVGDVVKTRLMATIETILSANNNEGTYQSLLARDYAMENLGHGERFAQKVAVILENIAASLDTETKILISIFPDEICKSCFGGPIGQHCTLFTYLDSMILNDINQRIKAGKLSGRIYYESREGDPIGVLLPATEILKYINMMINKEF